MLLPPHSDHEGFILTCGAAREVSGLVRNLTEVCQNTLGKGNQRWAG